ncbi:MAG: DUF1638 domain-containing protein [Syntrophales bacterium]|jgi:hypothetical protein|nr:DUF1638 domain-containing protein [Syntrophales bacterium]MDD4339667.1 DUF1638 domain-containing protein [Syntrophales bacterium]HOG06928.1 DUF1638 domain-containing protein [Syntrophales bacterium]HOS76805.1 DUF1638 domain-containing protein [Syntrophales bacterium]
MISLLLACNTIREEICAVADRLNAEIPMVFLEAGLHIFPERLHQSLQTEIDGVDDAVSHILLGFGFCGNALVGLRSTDKTLVVPKVDDCITLLLGSIARRIEINSEGSYYLTRGWLDNRITIWDEYKHCLERYGEQQTRIIMRGMIGHYRRLVLLDTGVPGGGNWRETAGRMASAFALQTIEVEGTSLLIEKLLRGAWDEDFLVLPPGTEIERSMLLDASSTDARSGGQHGGPEPPTAGAATVRAPRPTRGTPGGEGRGGSVSAIGTCGERSRHEKNQG